MKNSIETKGLAVNETVVKPTGPKTLRELGLEGGLAADFELALRLMGAVKGERVVGYTFTTPHGQHHALRVERSEGHPDVARAA